MWTKLKQISNRTPHIIRIHTAFLWIVSKSDHFIQMKFWNVTLCAEREFLWYMSHRKTILVPSGPQYTLSWYTCHTVKLCSETMFLARGVLYKTVFIGFVVYRTVFWQVFYYTKLFSDRWYTVQIILTVVRFDGCHTGQNLYSHVYVLTHVILNKFCLDTCPFWSPFNRTKCDPTRARFDTCYTVPKSLARVHFETFHTVQNCFWQVFDLTRVILDKNIWQVLIFRFVILFNFRLARCPFREVYSCSKMV